MSASEIDDYLDGVGDEHRRTLAELRATIAALLPDAEQGLSYGVPVFRLGGRPIAGFSAAKRHVSYLPHSGEVLASMSVEELGGFEATKGAVKLPLGSSLPEEVVRRLIQARRDEAGV